MPGKEWADLFMKRHPELSNRTANLIKRSRAAISREDVAEFINNYADTVGDIPPENIWNYDETNLVDNPGSVKAVFARGCKYAEMVKDSSKSSVSIMFCGSAAGEFMPPYVVYKAQNLYPTWCEGGPDGTRYNISPSGWFDMNTFADWFKLMFLPTVARMDGKKVMIGDNLRSHISDEVMQLCGENNIEFVCLPPNSTDKLQPLDVGVYGPMKKAWRNILQDEKAKNPKLKAVDKNVFPGLVKKLVEKLDASRLLGPALEKCGLYPISVEKACERIPSIEASVSDSGTTFDQELMDRLKIARFGDGKSKERKTRGKKIPPGKSWSRQEMELQIDQPDTDSDIDEPHESEMDIEEGNESDVVEEPEEQTSSIRDSEHEEYKVGDFVAAIYEEEWFVAQVEGEEPDEEEDGLILLKYMKQTGGRMKNSFIWPDKDDIFKTKESDILCKVSPPEPVSNRAFGLNIADLNVVETMMVKWFMFFLLNNSIRFLIR